jgi:opacity protein-like surface antigen
MTLTKFIRTGAAALGALAVATQVNAADLYTGGGGSLKDVPPPPPLWTGFYAGVHLGAAWTEFGNQTNTFYDQWGNGANFGKGIENTTAFGGGQFGYNWQAPWGWSNVVLGIEVDLDGVGGNNEKSFFPSTYDANGNLASLGAFTVKEQGGFAGDVTGRIGYAWGPALLYAKGGYAWLDTTFSARGWLIDSTGYYTTSNNWSHDTTLDGWTVGAGVEWLLNPNWSVKIEYLHYDFSSNNQLWNPVFYNGTGTAYSAYNSWRFDKDIEVDTIKLGVNYHLTSGYSAPLK